MIIFLIIILIVAKALPVLNTKIYSIHVTRITTIVFLFSGALTLNILNLENIGSGIGVYSGFFQVTTISQLIEIFLFLIGGGILMAWPLKQPNLSYHLFNLSYHLFNSKSSPKIKLGGVQKKKAVYKNFNIQNFKNTLAHHPIWPMAGRGYSNKNSIYSPVFGLAHSPAALFCTFPGAAAGPVTLRVKRGFVGLEERRARTKLNISSCATKNNLISSNLIHTSAIVYSDNTRRGVLEEVLSLSEESLSNLQLIKYKENIVEKDMSEIVGSFSNYRESFPWLVDTDGKIIDFNKTIDLFDGVKLISQFLEQRYNVEKDLISEVKLTELLGLFKDNKNITVIELFNHIGNIYNRDKNSLLKNLISEKEILAPSSLLDPAKIAEREGQAVVENTINLTNFKPFGVYGDKTLNEIGTGLLNLKWETILDTTKVTLHAAPLTVNLITFSFLLRGYMKYVHNRPYDTSPRALSLEMQKQFRRRNLVLFSLFGAPLVLYALRTSSIGIKNMINISLFNSETQNKKEILTNISFLLVINKFLKKIPTWLKFIFIFIILNIVVLKLLGYSIIVIIDQSFLKKLVFVYFFLVGGYQLLNLYLVHKFASKNVKIPEVFPDFWINWLKEFEVIVLSEESIKEFKKICYIELVIYLIMIIIFILIF
jgi:hypothetical protein